MYTPTRENITSSCTISTHTDVRNNSSNLNAQSFDCVLAVIMHHRDCIIRRSSTTCSFHVSGRLDNNSMAAAHAMFRTKQTLHSQQASSCKACRYVPLRLAVPECLGASEVPQRFQGAILGEAPAENQVSLASHRLGSHLAYHFHPAPAAPAEKSVDCSLVAHQSAGVCTENRATRIRCDFILSASWRPF